MNGFHHGSSNITLLQDVIWSPTENEYDHDQSRSDVHASNHVPTLPVCIVIKQTVQAGSSERVVRVLARCSTDMSPRSTRRKLKLAREKRQRYAQKTWWICLACNRLAMTSRGSLNHDWVKCIMFSKWCKVMAMWTYKDYRLITRTLPLHLVQDWNSSWNLGGYIKGFKERLQVANRLR